LTITRVVPGTANAGTPFVLFAYADLAHIHLSVGFAAE
jgi:hypothetical protein